ncbi:hypothetical protein B0F90DRAFT_1666597 [Multifurca ochricompacta]|uniref:VWFA domain-containing protein n=1 Tax=Multifurca ochricompacta TaxID=376703 RepID=A0AAD4M770_9AGAM|nr:hypothetical protein B0F90DRAFT_1666597 [Multifurca ochricompacta]
MAYYPPPTSPSQEPDLPPAQAYPPDVYSSPPPALPPTPTYLGKTPAWPSTSTSEPPAQVLRTPKTFLQWKADAQTTTASYQRNGFPSPIAWVFVEGHDIPPNAIIGGVDRKGPWHIARAFYEGSMELGKAGRHLRLGASISFNGRERDIDTYEVLVEANLPTRWVYSPIVLSASLRAAAPQPSLSCSDFKLVVIIDDSDSMEGKLWFEARDALAGVAELSRLKGGEGLDIYCLNSTNYRRDVRGETEVRHFFDSIVPEGQTPIGAKLRQVLDYYVPKIEDPASNTSQSVFSSSRMVSLCFEQWLTVNLADDPKSVIVDFARRLDARNVPLRQLGIQFVQIGDDRSAAEALRELDDELGPTHGVRDMVDTTPFSPNEPHLRTDAIVKIVLGAINSELDNRNPIGGPLIQY